MADSGTFARSWVDVRRRRKRGRAGAPAGSTRMAPSARRFALVAAFVAHCTSAGGAADAAGAAAPAPEKLQPITEFFDNEVATGKLPGAAILIQQHGRPVYLKCFGVRDVTSP